MLFLNRMLVLFIKNIDIFIFCYKLIVENKYMYKYNDVYN